MKGKNPIRRIVHGDGDLLSVKELFLTIQGECIFMGYPAIFIRLGGCNLSCSFCDTDFEDFTEMNLSDIMVSVKDLSGDTVKLVVITGGEPFRQPISKLCDELNDSGFIVQIETNGTIFRNIHRDVKIVCSPKNTGDGYRSIRDDLLSSVTAFKFLISKHNELYNFVPDVGQSIYNTPVYIQPMDEFDNERNEINLHYATDMALKYGYILSLQIHKMIGIA